MTKILVFIYKMFSTYNRFLFKFTGKDEEINLLGDGTEKAEFGEWSWMSPEQVVERVSALFSPPSVPFCISGKMGGSKCVGSGRPTKFFSLFSYQWVTH